MIKKLISKVLNLYKPPSVTPLQAIDKLRQKYPNLAKMKLGYAGRLDPMAEGVMLVLVGGENKVKQKYLNLYKEYIFDVLFGFSTDSFDILGKIIKINYNSPRKSKLSSVLKNFQGIISQKYPVYSTKSVKGKSLFDWARLGKLGEIEIPEQFVEIYSIKIVKNYMMPSAELKKFINNRINTLTGDFRQKEIIKGWEKVLKNNKLKFPVTRLKVNCSSGTYVRAIANELGNQLNVPALALKIVRTKVGDYKLKDSTKL